MGTDNRQARREEQQWGFTLHMEMQRRQLRLGSLPLAEDYRMKCRHEELEHAGKGGRNTECMAG